jgi:hypothetical protein
VIFAGKSVGSSFQATFSLQIIGQLDLRMFDAMRNIHWPLLLSVGENCFEVQIYAGKRKQSMGFYFDAIAF